jgi:hypothetical protein
MPKGNLNPIGKRSNSLRPGLVCKAVLSGQIPMSTGEYVSESSISDLHRAYCALIDKENMLRSRDNKLKGMTYSSFVKMFKFAQLLGLVEFVREENLKYAPEKTRLYSVRLSTSSSNRPIGKISKRRIFRLSTNGKLDEVSWGNLCTSWIKRWPIPQTYAQLGLEDIKTDVRIPVEPPAIEPGLSEISLEQESVRESVRKPMSRITKKPAEKKRIYHEEEVQETISVRKVEKFIPFRFTSKPSKAQYSAMVKHLLILRDISISNAEVRTEVKRLSNLIGNWSVELEDKIDIAKSSGDTQLYNTWRRIYTLNNDVFENLYSFNIDSAIRNIKSIILLS